MEFIYPDQFRQVVRERRPVLDVRAPIEFIEGSTPGSVNLPILNDEERHQIGTIYKELGQSAAVRLGHELVSGRTRATRIDAWVEFCAANPKTVLTCFRGGMRSQFAQQSLAEAGYAVPRLKGGTKAMRTYLRQELDQLAAQKFLLIGGPTGAGKSLIIENLSRPRLDLERLANHRGSAFGGLDHAQPSQIDFENQLAAEWIRLDLDTRPLVLEDEGAMIGRRCLPLALLNQMRASPLVVVDESLESRVELTWQIYVERLNSAQLEMALARARQALQNISRKLGGARHQEVLADLDKAHASGERSAHRGWIEKLLRYYYDPLYLNSLKAREGRFVFRGSRAEVQNYLTSKY